MYHSSGSTILNEESNSYISYNTILGYIYYCAKNVYYFTQHLLLRFAIAANVLLFIRECQHRNY